MQRFLGDKKTQGLTVNVLRKYERELGRFAAFMTKRSHLFPRDIGSEDIAVFREGWQDLYPSPTTRSKVQDRLKTFLRYCYDTRLIDQLPQLLPSESRSLRRFPSQRNNSRNSFRSFRMSSLMMGATLKEFVHSFCSFAIVGSSYMTW